MIAKRDTSRMNSNYLTDAEFQRRKASLAGTLAESLAYRILVLKGFHLYRPWLLQLELERPSVDNFQYYDLDNELAKSAYERDLDYKALLKEERVRGFLVEVVKLREQWSPRESIPSYVRTEGLPDIIAKKGKEIYAIEVKTGRSYLLLNQARVLELANKHGIKPYVLHMKIYVKIKGVNIMKMESYPRKRKR